MDEEYNEQSHSDYSAGTGGGEAGSAQAWLGRLTKRLPGDIRIHDDTQAGELARRLGARAFTVGRHIYVRPDLVKPMTPEGAALLAHEMSHATEQSGAAPIDMPLLLPGLGAATNSGAEADAPHTPAWQGQAQPSAEPAGASAPVQRAPAGVPRSEVAAEAIESAAYQAQQQGQQPDKPPTPKRAKQAPPDPEEIADRVYRLIVQDLVLDRERAAYTW
jgi:hypothetical protein